MSLRSFSSFLLTALGVVLFADERPAHACGGCFHSETDTNTSFVTDHRMAISISTKQTVLWDQVKYTGDPSEFAWVLPVSAGARVELARDEWDEAVSHGAERFVPAAAVVLLVRRWIEPLDAHELLRFERWRWRWRMRVVELG